MKPAEITREGVGGGEPVCGLLRACPLVDEMGMLLLEKEAIGGTTTVSNYCCSTARHVTRIFKLTIPER
jgi:hypothetical protein